AVMISIRAVALIRVVVPTRPAGFSAAAPAVAQHRESAMSIVRESIEVAVPVRVAYERLCHFEDYPQFMTGVQQVTQLSENVAHWVMELGGTQTEFNAQITERRPGEMLAWQAIDGLRRSEELTRQQLSDSNTRIIDELDIDSRQRMPCASAQPDSLDRQHK